LQDAPNRDDFPYGPRNLDDPKLAAANDKPESDEKKAPAFNGTVGEAAAAAGFAQRRRRRRAVNVSDAGNADVGVSGLYDVISRSDLAFTPDAKTDGDAMTIFQGRIREDVVYGICMPVHGFGALFVMFAGSAVVSVVVAGFQLHKYQVRRETQKIMAAQAHHRQQHVGASRHQQPPHGHRQPQHAAGGYIQSSLAGIAALNKLLASKSAASQARRNS